MKFTIVRFAKVHFETSRRFIDVTPTGSRKVLRFTACNQPIRKAPTTTDRAKVTCKNCLGALESSTERNSGEV